MVAAATLVLLLTSVSKSDISEATSPSLTYVLITLALADLATVSQSTKKGDISSAHSVDITHNSSIVFCTAMCLYVSVK